METTDQTHNFEASQQSIRLVAGTVDEITQALRELGASPATIAKAGVSFLVKIPDAVVSRVNGGFQVGGSMFPELGLVKHIESGVQETLQRLMMTPVANDERFAIAA